MPEIILPGTYITVRDEGLITAGRVSTGNIGIVGTANKGPINEVKIIGSFTEARELFGDKDEFPTAANTRELTLIRALEQIYNNGGRTVYAVRTAATTPAAATPAAATGALKDSEAAPADLLRLTANTTGTWGNDLEAKVSIPDGEPAGTRLLEISDGVVKERFQASNITNLVAALGSSRLVTAALLGAAGTRVLAATAVPVKLAGGKNGENASATNYRDSLALLKQDIINIVLLAGQPASDANMLTALQGHIAETSEIKRERIALTGSKPAATFDEVRGVTDSLSHERIIYVAPGIKAGGENLSGAYTAAAVAGLLSSLPVQASATNKTLNIPGLEAEYSSSKLENLVQRYVLAVEKREGFRVVKGITTATNSAWHQITTRRIVDYAIYGVRSACNPYIGKLNNERVRGAMKATLDAFLTRMVQDEALVSYELDVSATRAQEIAGECAVTMTIRPTFSIDFVRVTMYLG